MGGQTWWALSSVRGRVGKVCDEVYPVGGGLEGAGTSLSGRYPIVGRELASGMLGDGMSRYSFFVD